MVFCLQILLQTNDLHMKSVKSENLVREVMILLVSLFVMLQVKSAYPLTLINLK